MILKAGVAGVGWFALMRKVARWLASSSERFLVGVSRNAAWLSSHLDLLGLERWLGVVSVVWVSWFDGGAGWSLFRTLGSGGVVRVRLVGLGWMNMLMSMLMVFFAGFFLGTVVRDKLSSALSLVMVLEIGGLRLLVFFAGGETKGDALVFDVLAAGWAAGATLGVGLRVNEAGFDIVGRGMYDTLRLFPVGEIRRVVLVLDLDLC